MVFRVIRELIDYHSQHTEKFAKHDYFNVFLKTIRDLNETGYNINDSHKILDLGCGQRYPLSLLFSSMCESVTALDINYVKHDLLPIFFYHVWKHNGLDRAIKSIVRRIFFDKRYYKILEKSAGLHLFKNSKRIHFITSDPTTPKYPLESESFNLIVSNAVIEHIENVSQYVHEIDRLLVKKGYFYGIIHNYYSLSGGHHLEWAYPDEYPSNKVPPWDHLRKNLFPTHVYLNRYKPNEYKKEFAKRLEIKFFEERDINHDPKGTEGKRFLTESLSSELATYSKELLLTRSWCIICQKS